VLRKYCRVLDKEQKEGFADANKDSHERGSEREFYREARL
jgi:hypothetical protein